MRIPLLLVDFIHARAYRPKCEKFLTRPVRAFLHRQNDEFLHFANKKRAPSSDIGPVAALFFYFVVIWKYQTEFFKFITGQNSS